MQETTIVYHRCGGKSLNYPPNTIVTAKWAVAHGAKAIEYDVVLAQDSNDPKIVVIDTKVIKQAGLDINNLKWSDVKNLNAGNNTFGFQKIPLLEEMFSGVDDSKTGHQIHLKGQSPDAVKVLLEKIRDRYNYIITTFDISVIQKIKSIDKNVPVGWLVKPRQERGDEAGVDLTAKLVADIDNDNIEQYSQTEITEILQISGNNSVDVVLLCGPRIKKREVVEQFKREDFSVGAWGVATNLSLAKQLIQFGLDRFTLDNPEQLI